MTRWQRVLSRQTNHNGAQTTSRKLLRGRRKAGELSLFRQLDQICRTDTHHPDWCEVPTHSPAFLPAQAVRVRAATLESLSAEEYYETAIAPLENGERWPVTKLLDEISERVIREEKRGPLYLAEIELKDGGQVVRMGVVAQHRQESNGVWRPEHHHQAARWVREMEARRLPILTLMDTPGADAGADANERNQAHSISALIATMADLTVPSIGIVLGVGYSGGAIPLATTNLLLSVRDGLFNTIQPQGLAAIARKQKLDWKACAQAVGVTACELWRENVIDAVIDYSPAEGKRHLEHFRDAILQGLTLIERQSQLLVAQVDSLPATYLKLSQRLAEADLSAFPTRQLYLQSVQQFPSIFGMAFRALRGVRLRKRLKTSEGKPADDKDLAHSGETEQSVASLLENRFREWLARDEKLVYEEPLFRGWQRFQDSRQQLGVERSYLVQLLRGHPQSNYDKATNDLTTSLAFHLYKRWQRDAHFHLEALGNHLRGRAQPFRCDSIASEQLTLTDILYDDRFLPLILEHCHQLRQFDVIYEKVLARLTEFVSELSERKTLSGAFMQQLLEDAGLTQGEVRDAFEHWLNLVRSTPSFHDDLRVIEQWKKQQHPRLSSVAFVVASYFFEKLLPEFFESQRAGKPFAGRFQPVSIGRRKDFWNQLKQATIDLRIQAVLNEIKPASLFTPRKLLDHLFTDFKELDVDLTTANPCQFPGFASAIQRQRAHGHSASGLLTGVARFHRQQSLGVFVSNHGFQAGAFDMASAERLCRLLAHCAELGIPVVGFLCSGGMQTKEGASALFSMAVVNDQINRFVMEMELPILIIGYGDCTGGAQASLATHPLVDSYYLSGTNMPFAGRIVVPDYLPVTSTLSNYLMNKPGSMRGLVKHPFVADLDDRLKAIDPQIAVASIRLDELLENWLQNRESHVDEMVDLLEEDNSSNLLPAQTAPFKKVLVHARGCTAVKLIRAVHAADLQAVLVQSDPDMDSVAADSLREGDELVCLGGYTSEESYLNGDSVLRIAELSGAEALHPGIGFLSENASFAQACLAQGLVFVGPAPASMLAMGDKACAIRTAMAAGVPVVPGSHGILRDVEHAREEAERIGFPVILKAAHGGGGKGILEVHHAEDLEAAFRRIQTEGKSAFGRDEVYLERLVTRFRHIEVQLLRDRFGCTRILGLRDCSVQRNKQKILEESGSTLLPQNLREVAFRSAASLADACNYLGAGTVEYIFDLDQQQLYFMEMNTRLQVEHPVTECCSSVDIVREQFRIAMGKSIDQLPIQDKGYAIEVRINAERVSLDSQGQLQVVPCPGTVTEAVFPDRGNIIRIVCVGAGKTISPYYDNLVAQVIAHADTRENTIRLLRDYLKQVRVEGIQTNIPLLLTVLEDEAFIGGDFDTGYLKSLPQRKPKALQDHDTAPTHLSEALQAIRVAGSDELKVFAPSSSILYRSPSPNQPAYVEEGDRVTADQALCLLEVMKMFQPLSLSSFNRPGQELYDPDWEYQITHIKGVDGQHVNQGDLLFVVKPVAKKTLPA